MQIFNWGFGVIFKTRFIMIKACFASVAKSMIVFSQKGQFVFVTIVIKANIIILLEIFSKCNVEFLYQNRDRYI